MLIASRLLAAALFGLVLSACSGDGRAADAQAVTASLEFNVQLREAFLAPPGMDGGHWTVRYSQRDRYVFRRSGDASTSTYSVRPERALATPSLQDIDGYAYTICYDGEGQSWRTEREPPVEVEPVALTTTSEGGQLVLWASVPEVHMQHPGDHHIPQRSECYTVDAPYREHFMLHDAELEDAGAEIDRFGSHRLASFTWEEIAAAAEGRGPALAFTMSHAASGVLFQIEGVIATP